MIKIPGVYTAKKWVYWVRFRLGKNTRIFEESVVANNKSEVRMILNSRYGSKVVTIMSAKRSNKKVIVGEKL